ncbi:MAG: UMP kinase [Candidatus Woesearchaeota archaeon]
MNADTYVISLSGSLICPSEENISFLKEFRKLIISHAGKGNVNKGKMFIIICGGGQTNRQYNEAFRSIIGASEVSDESLDLLGIAATKMNGEFVRLMFGEYAAGKLLEDPNEKLDTDKRIIIGTGWKPGCSSDKDAVLAAKTYGADTVINLTNVDHVYTKDPRKYEDAERIESISWKEFRSIVGETWSPKLDSPFDPIAANLAEQEGIKAIIARGKNIDNLKRIIEGKEFVGSVIS